MHGGWKGIGMAADDVRHVERVNDPVLGPRWIVVCPWHGATGRYSTKREAVAAGARYHTACSAGNQDERG